MLNLFRHSEEADIEKILAHHALQSRTATDAVTRKAVPRPAAGAARGHLHHRRRGPHHLLQPRLRRIRRPHAENRRDVVRDLEAVLAGRLAAGPRRLPDGDRDQGKPHRPRRRGDRRTARRFAHLLCTLSDPAARRERRADRRRQHAGRHHHAQAGRRADDAPDPGGRSSRQQSARGDPGDAAPDQGRYSRKNSRRRFRAA